MTVSSCVTQESRRVGRRRSVGGQYTYKYWTQENLPQSLHRLPPYPRVRPPVEGARVRPRVGLLQVDVVSHAHSRRGRATTPSGEDHTRPLVGTGPPTTPYQETESPTTPSRERGRPPTLMSGRERPTNLVSSEKDTHEPCVGERDTHDPHVRRDIDDTVSGSGVGSGPTDKNRLKDSGDGCDREISSRGESGHAPRGGTTEPEERGPITSFDREGKGRVDFETGPRLRGELGSSGQPSHARPPTTPTPEGTRVTTGVRTTCGPGPTRLDGRDGAGRFE